MWLASLSAMVIAAAPFERSTRAWPAEIALEGPLGGVVLDMGATGETQLVGTLLAGETRRIVVPLPARSAAERFAPTIRTAPLVATAEPLGAVRFVRWIEPGPTEFDALPPGLRTRARPPVSREIWGPSTAALLALAALAALVTGLDRRPRASLALAAVGAVAVACLPLVRANEFEPFVRLVEGDAQSDVWLEVEAAFEHLAILPPLGSDSIEAWPSDARLVWRVPIDPQGVLAVDGRDVRLYRIGAWDRGDGSIQRADNRVMRLEEAWVREGGEWRAHGAWPLGAALGPPLPESAEGPPGWLASGLPQGPTILVGRIKPRGVAESQASFLRLVNFE